MKIQLNNIQRELGELVWDDMIRQITTLRLENAELKEEVEELKTENQALLITLSKINHGWT